MSEQVTIVVVPRDRFSSVIDCTRSILANTPVPFRLTFLDFGYSVRTLDQIRKLCAEVPLEIVPCGRTIPIIAFRNYLPQIKTPYVAWVDNDTYVTPGWMEALLERAAAGARVILPVTLEREGLDVDPRKIPLRNHISHGELRKIAVEGREYVFDYKPFRRAAPEELPQEPHTVDFFELHTFFAETEVLRQLELPAMVVREHIDIGIQLWKMGIDIWCEPKSVVHFDNIHKRPTWGDLKFFFFRWNEKLINQSHTLFEERWGYRFYNEQFMKNWAFRRKVYSVCRFMGLPQGISDWMSRALNKVLRPAIPPQLRKDPLAESTLVLERPGVAGYALQ
jgi:hypothetical protein